LWANYFDAIDKSLLDEHLRTTFVKCGERNRVIKLPSYRKRRSHWFMPLKGQFWMTLSRCVGSISCVAWSLAPLNETVDPI
jgi:hypothetical protein